jgi:hypothetical protein
VNDRIFKATKNKSFGERMLKLTKRKEKNKIAWFKLGNIAYIGITMKEEEPTKLKEELAKFLAIIIKDNYKEADTAHRVAETLAEEMIRSMRK